MRTLAALVTCALLAACTTPLPLESVSAQFQPPVFTTAHQCREHLRAPALNSTFSDYNALPSQLDILVWNTQKSPHKNWDKDLQQLTADAELILLQEASSSLLHSGAAFPIAVWGTGYHSRQGPTGVLSGSRIMPLASCRFQDMEPWLRTPKASSISRYALAGRDDSLLVANIHAVNFSWGMSAMERQLARLADVLREHRGPILFAGDFNTWRGARLQLVEKLMQELALTPAPLSEDQRSTVFGYPLDHVYSRGLELIEARTETARVSDHNPLWLSVAFKPPTVN